MLSELPVELRNGIGKPTDSLLRSAIGPAISLRRRRYSWKKMAKISGDNVVECSLAFNSKTAANFNERYSIVCR